MGQIRRGLNQCIRGVCDIDGLGYEGVCGVSKIVINDLDECVGGMSDIRRGFD